MSSNIASINETLRTFANSGFDMSNNRGILLNGKFFPANFKELHIPSEERFWPKLHSSFKAQIPLETGNTIRIEHNFFDDNKTSTSLFLRRPLMYKTSYTKPNDWVYGYGSYSAEQGLYSYGTEHDNESHPMYVGDPANGEHIVKVPQINNNTDWDSLHKQIAEFSKMASFGTKIVNRENYAMNPNDYKEHSLRVGTDTKHHKPNMIKITKFNNFSDKTDYLFSNWRYDLNTEQLEKFGEWQ